MANGGARPGAGRPKGSPNIFTRKMREDFLESFERLGGVEWFVRLGHDSPSTYAGLIKVFCPVTVSGPDEGPINVRQRLVIELIDGSPRSGP